MLNAAKVLAGGTAGRDQERGRIEGVAAKAAARVFGRFRRAHGLACSTDHVGSARPGLGRRIRRGHCAVGFPCCRRCLGCRQISSPGDDVSFRPRRRRRPRRHLRRRRSLVRCFHRRDARGKGRDGFRHRRFTAVAARSTGPAPVFVAGNESRAPRGTAGLAGVDHLVRPPSRRQRMGRGTRTRLCAADPGSPMEPRPSRRERRNQTADRGAWAATGTVTSTGGATGQDK
jgi:hypothetical protein